MPEMTAETLRPALAEARRERDQAEADMVKYADAQKRFHDFSLTVQGLEAWLERLLASKTKGSSTAGKGSAAADVIVNGAVIEAKTAKPYLRPKDAILRLMEEQPRDWSLSEFVVAMRERGWLDPSLAQPTEATRAAATRLVEVDHKLTRIGKSMYRPAGRKFTIRLGDQLFTTEDAKEDSA
jgi:hypothetical protein